MAPKDRDFIGCAIPSISLILISFMVMAVCIVIINPSTLFGCPHCGRTFFNSGTTCRGCDPGISLPDRLARWGPRQAPESG